MTDLFFFGSLRDRALLELVLGRPVSDRDIAPARAPGFATFALADEAYPFLAEAAGAAAQGIVVSGISSDDLERLTYFEETEYGLQPITIESAGVRREVQHFASTGKAATTDGLWDYNAWLRDEKPVAMEAASELMAHMGIVPMEQIDTIWTGIMIRARMRARAKAETPVTGRFRAARPADDVISVRIGRPYTAYFALEQHRLRHRRFDGAMSEPIERSVLTSGDAVTVIPYDPVKDRVMLIEQFRAPMFARGDTCPWGIEAIAGRIDQETDAEICARREALEEGGVTLGRVEIVSRYYSSPGITAEHITSFVGQATLDDEGGIYGVAHENEDIRAFTCQLDAAMEAVASGEINNAPAILSLLWLRQHRVRLQREWIPALA